MVIRRFLTEDADTTPGEDGCIRLEKHLIFSNEKNKWQPSEL